MSEENLSDLLKQYKNLLSKVTTTEIIRDNISQDGVIKETEEKTEIDEEGLKVGTTVEIRFADCGHTIKNAEDIGGRCYRCNSIVCMSCISVCLECGKGVCKEHLFVTDKGETYCTSCKWKVLFKKFMGF